MKKKINKCWTISCQGFPQSFYVRQTRRDAIEAFNNNIVQPPSQSSEPRRTIKDYKLYKPVKIEMRIVS